MIKRVIRKSVMEKIYEEQKNKTKEEIVKKCSNCVNILKTTIDNIGEFGIFLLRYIYNNRKGKNYLTINISEFLEITGEDSYNEDKREKTIFKIIDICDYLHSIVYGEDESYRVIHNYRLYLFDITIIIGNDFNILYNEIETYLGYKEKENDTKI